VPAYPIGRDDLVPCGRAVRKLRRGRCGAPESALDISPKGGWTGSVNARLVDSFARFVN